MIGASLLMMFTLQPTPAPAADEIVVIGRRLKTWQGQITPAGKAIRCVTTRSSGDADVDKIGCGAMVICFTPMRARMDDASSRRRPPRERQAMMAAIEKQVGTCLAQRHEQLIADLAERRSQARQGSLNAQD